MTMATKEDITYRAKMAEQAERYEDVAAIMMELAKMNDALSIEERNLLSLAYKNVIGSRRTAWRTLVLIEQRTAQRIEIKKANLEEAVAAGKDCAEQETSIKHYEAKLEQIRKYKAVIEEELDSRCNEVLDLLLNNLIPSSGPEAESTVFYLKMRGDYFRYMAEYKTDAARTKVTEQSEECYSKAMKLAEAELPPTSPIRLGLALNFSVFKFEIMESPSEACDMAKAAFNAAIPEVQELTAVSYREATMILQLIRDNLTLWTSDSPSGVVDPEAGMDDAAAVEGETGDGEAEAAVAAS